MTFVMFLPAWSQRWIVLRGMAFSPVRAPSKAGTLGSGLIENF